VLPENQGALHGNLGLERSPTAHEEHWAPMAEGPSPRPDPYYNTTVGNPGQLPSSLGAIENQVPAAKNYWTAERSLGRRNTKLSISNALACQEAGTTDSSGTGVLAAVEGWSSSEGTHPAAPGSSMNKERHAPPRPMYLGQVKQDGTVNFMSTFLRMWTPAAQCPKLDLSDLALHHGLRAVECCKTEAYT
jgi:hypothetical protein